MASHPNPGPEKPSFFIYVVAGIAALAGLLFGFDTGVISGALPFIKKDWLEVANNPTLEGLIVGAVVGGAIIGSILGGPLSQKFGRRNVIIVTAVIFAIGSIATAFAPTPTLLIIGRLFIGIAIGIASFVAPMYIGEVAPPTIRGGLVSLNQLMITIGIMMSYGVCYVFASMAESGTLHGSHAWGWMLGVGAVPALILGVSMIFLPESPRWLAKYRSNDSARKVLRHIRGTQDVDYELKEINIALAFKDGGWSELKAAWLKPLLFAGIGLGILQQVTGINTIIYYAPTILLDAGYESDSAAILATVFVGLVNVIMTIAAVFLMDRLGRRPLLITGMTGMALSTAIFGYVINFQLLDDYSWLPVACLMLYVASFAISLGPIFWLIISEIYPLNARSRAMSLATMIQWVTNLIVTTTFPDIVAGFGLGNTFWLFGILSVVGIIFCYLFIPETKGVTLEQIEEQCRKGVPLRKISAHPKN